MNEAAPNFEMLLREALAPVDPPEDLVQRLESTLTSLALIAAEELEGWELSAMRDPRNWVRPAAALVVGTSAAAALVVLRARQRPEPPPPRGVTRFRDAATRARDEIGQEARRRLGRG